MKDRDEQPLEADREVRRVKFAGGAIKKPKRKEPKRDEKIEQALATKVGGGMRFYDKQHEYMHHKLSGKGGMHDSPECRGMMYSMLQHHHPSLWNSYMAGKVKDLPIFKNDHHIPERYPAKVDRRPHMVDRGGSLNAITHSENGFLVSHNPEFHHILEVV